MSQNLLLKISGLYTFPSHLGAVPQGGLLSAKNIIVNRDSVAESRRGYKLYGSAMGISSSNIAHQLFSYKSRIFRHWGSTLDYDTDQSGTFSSAHLLDTVGSVSEVSNYPGLNYSPKIKTIEQSGNAYFTSAKGIQKISASGASGLPSAVITAAGGVKALDLQASLNPSPGFLTQECVIAYRLVWGVKDANQNLILGAPSSRTIISNPLTNLLIKDFNSLLTKLDLQTLSTGIHAQTYSSNFKVTSNASSYNLLTNIEALAAGLDADIPAVNTTSFSSNSSYFTMNVGTANIFKVGDPITIAGVTPSGYNGDFTIASILSPTSFTVTSSANPGTSGAVNGTIKRRVYDSITKPTFVTPATPSTTELEDLQKYYGFIVGRLQVELSGILTSPSDFNTNTATTSATVDLSFVIPDGVTEAHFYQIYRTFLTKASISLSNDGTGSPLDPGDECKLAYEGNLPSGFVIGDTVTIQDVTPDSFLGANLYTNPNSGEGITQANDVPPLAKDIASFKGYTFFANTQTKQQLNLSLLSVTKFVSGVSSFTITDGTITDTYKFVQNLAQIQTITTVADVAGSLNGSYFLINSGANSTEYYVWLSSGAADPAISGKTGIKVTFTNGDSANTLAGLICSALNGVGDFVCTNTSNVVKVFNTSSGISTAASNGTISPGFSYSVVSAGQGEDANSRKIAFTPAQSGYITGISVANPTVVTSASHGLVTGQLVTISGSDSTPSINGTYPITKLTNDTFSLPLNVTVSGTLGTWATSPFYTPSQQVDECARSLVRVINKDVSEIVNAYYLSSSTDIPGLLFFEGRTLAQTEFKLLTDSSLTGNEFDPKLAPTGSITNISIANPTIITCVGHGLSTGDSIAISGSDSTPSIDGIRTITKLTNDTFSVAVNVTSSGSVGGFELASLAETSSNEIKPNRIYYSKYQQPEAVPILNYLDVGPQDKNILRILALRDNLFILKEEGVYRLSGASAPFSVYLFDSSTNLISPDSAVVLNNLIYMYSTQGVARISDTGIEVISRPIEDLLLPLYTPTYTNFETSTFGVSYESDRSYYLFTVTNPSDTYATQCFRYNTFTNSWTKLMISKHAGIVNPGDDRLYLAPVDTNYIEQERKSFDRTDYADREHGMDLGSNAVNGTSVVLPTLTNVSAGDVLLQEQYLTISQFNRLLNKLDSDSKLTTSYTSQYVAIPGVALHTALDTIITAIANDPGRTGGFPSSNYTDLLPTSTSFSSMQTTFNSLITLLNSDPGVGSKNFITSSGTVPYEFVILSLDKGTNSVVTSFSYPLIQGPVTIFNNIPVELQWVPQTLTDTSITKHASEGTLIFEDSSFTNATISYASDLSANFDNVLVTGNGNGIFGNLAYGQGLFGGNGSGVPFRTFIPKDKQRLRYLNVKFSHAIARESFALYGCSISFNPVSTRGYR